MLLSSLVLMDVSTDSSVVEKELIYIMSVKSRHLCSVAYAAPRETPCLFSYSRIAGYLENGISSLASIYATKSLPIRDFSSRCPDKSTLSSRVHR